MRFKALVLSLFFASGVFAGENLNWKGMLDTTTVYDLVGTATKVTKAFTLSNAENKLVAVVFQDTVNALRVNDSCAFQIGYQLGTPVSTFAGKTDTVWSAGIVLDTINTTAADKMYNPATLAGTAFWSLDPTTETNTRPHGQIDSTVSTSSFGVSIPFLPLWSPYIRFWVKGTSDNGGTAIQMRIIFEQRGYVYTRGM